MGVERRCKCHFTSFFVMLFSCCRLLLLLKPVVLNVQAECRVLVLGNNEVFDIVSYLI